MAETDPIAVAKAAILARFQDLAVRYQKTAADIDALRQVQQRLSAEAQDCHAAARLFGFDLVAASAAAGAQSKAGVQEIDAAPPPPPIPQQAHRTPTIRDFVLDAAKQAYPKPVRASALRIQLERQGTKTHPKTIGMTCFRLSRDKLLRRDGSNWYFVPQLEINGAKDSGVTAPEPATVHH